MSLQGPAPVRVLRGDEISLPENLSTPSFVVLEDIVLSNLLVTAAAAGGVKRLMPHVKTHRAPWMVKLLMAHGVTSFKCATPAEVEMLLAAGATSVTWAYPTPNRTNIKTVVEAARRNPHASIFGMVDSNASFKSWLEELIDRPSNVSLIVDLDTGQGRTGIDMISEAAFELARSVHSKGLYAGLHAYDGHIRGVKAQREQAVAELAVRVADLIRRLSVVGATGRFIAGGSHTFNIWPRQLATFVSPGSFVYSSFQHQADLPELGWRPAAFVATTVISTRGDTATLDAGVKAIAPDKSLNTRFEWFDEVLSMNEEHTIVRGAGLNVGDRLLLVPGHTCTTAYLYERALVRNEDGIWEARPQMGSIR